MELQAFDSSYFRGKSSSEDDSRQKYLVFHAVYKYFNIQNIKEMYGEISRCRFCIRKLFFGAVKLTQNAHPDKYQYWRYSVYGFGFGAFFHYQISR